MASVILMLRSESMTIAAPSAPSAFFNTKTITAGQTSHTENYSLVISENEETGRSTNGDL
jgi:hypothetical protein